MGSQKTLMFSAGVDVTKPQKRDCRHLEHHHRKTTGRSGENHHKQLISIRVHRGSIVGCGVFSIVGFLFIVVCRGFLCGFFCCGVFWI
jgi:hypothetical protein